MNPVTIPWKWKCAIRYFDKPLVQHQRHCAWTCPEEREYSNAFGRDEHDRRRCHRLSLRGSHEAAVARRSRHGETRSVAWLAHALLACVDTRVYVRPRVHEFVLVCK